MWDRDKAAAAAMTAGIALSSIGAGVIGGGGVALITLGALLIALSILLGWRS